MIGEGLITNTLENMSFSTLQDGRISFTSTVNGEPREMIKELDGTLTANGQKYYPYEKSIEEFKQSSSEASVSTQEQQTESEPITYDELQSGENLNEFVTRNSITLEKLFELNGDLTDVPLSPGMSLRVR